MNRDDIVEKEEPGGVESISRAMYIRNFLLFLLMGAGANFVLPTALVQEVPYFENELPEKLCISTYMNLMTSLGLLTMLTYLFVNTYVCSIPYSISVPGMLFTSAITSFVVAGVYSITINKVSVLLYICCFIGGSVGALSSVIMNPFMTAYTNDSISAVRVGGSSFTLLCAVIAAGQRPGSSNQTFSASIYLVIFGILLTLAIPAYYYILSQSLGKRPPQLSDRLPGSNKDGRINSTADGTESGRMNSVNPMMESSIAGKSIQSFEISSTSDGKLHSLETVEFASREATSLIGLKGQPIMDFIARTLVTDTMDETYPWLRKTLPYMMVVGWVNFNTWGILSAMIPFAISNAYNSDGAGDLGIALQVAAVLLVLGDLSTTVFKLDLLYGSIVFTILCIVIYCAAMDAPGMSTPAAGPILIIVFSIERFIESHLVTASLRAIATDFPLVHREIASRAVGISNQVCTTLGALLSTLVVYLLFKCG